MRVIDFHAHYFGRVFFETLAAQSPLEGDVETKLLRLAERTGILLPSPNNGEHATRWLSELERHDVDHMCTFASVPEEVPAVVEAAFASKGRLSAFAVVNPRVEGAAAKIRGLLEKRAIKGVLLFPAMHHYAIGGPESKPLLEALDDHAGVCYAHCGVLVVKLRDLLKLPRPQDLAYANPLAIVPAANAHRRVSFVIPHFGAGFFRETLMAGASAENIHVDTSSSNGWMATQPHKPTLAEVFARTREVFGHERILFGTDSNTFPAGWRKDRFEEQLAAWRVLGAGLSAEEAVFGGNARRILALPPSA